MTLVSTGLAEPQAVAKSKDTSVRVSHDAADVLRRVAALRKVSIGEYIDAVLVPIVRRDLISEAQKITRESKPPKPR